jgi:hypothetical protein
MQKEQQKCVNKTISYKIQTKIQVNYNSKSWNEWNDDRNGEKKNETKRRLMLLLRSFSNVLT